MSKRKGNKVKQETKAAPKQEAPKSIPVPVSNAGAVGVVQATATQSKPLKLKVLKADMVYRGARLAWYARVKEFDGKTEGEFIESAKQNPPALTQNQTAENPTGWVSFFKREGVLSLQNAG